MAVKTSTKHPFAKQGMELDKIIVIVILLFCSLACATGREQTSQFCELALPQCSGRWDLMKNLSVGLSNDSVPSNSLKPLRNSILQIRDVLDVFPFCFSPQSPDVWKLLRCDVNVGYTLLGDFIDLHNVNYTADAEAKLKSALLNWLELFENHSSQYQYETYFNAPDTTGLYFRKQSAYSALFWGNTSDVPSNTTSGLNGISILMLAQIENLSSRYSTLCSFVNLTTVDNANYMHDYKKQLRALLNVVKMFPTVLANSTHTEALLQAAEECYAILDKTHTIIVPYLYYLNAGQPIELAYSEVLVDKAFFAMKQWFEENAWPDWLGLFSSLVVLE